MSSSEPPQSDVEPQTVEPPAGADRALPDAGQELADVAAAAERLSFRVVPAWIMSGLVALVVLTALGAGGLQLLDEELQRRMPWLPTAALVAFGALALWTFLQPLLAWLRWRFGIDETLLHARHGILFHEEKVIPMSRLQHVDLTRGPIERLFGLATLIVHTAGSEGATFRLPGLRDARARELRERILEARGDDVV